MCFVDVIPCGVRTQIADRRFYITELCRKFCFVAGPVLYGCHHKTCSRKFAQICQMCRLVNAQPCTATDPDNTGIIVCRIFRINQIHTKILRGVSEPCICLCKCDVCNHGILRCSRFHMNCSFHTNSPLQCCFLPLL